MIVVLALVIVAAAVAPVLNVTENANASDQDGETSREGC